MRTSWRRQPIDGNFNLTSWKGSFVALDDQKNKENSIEVTCLYEDITPGYGQTIDEAKADFLENIRLKISELSDMLEFCAKNQPNSAPRSWVDGKWETK